MEDKLVNLFAQKMNLIDSFPNEMLRAVFGKLEVLELIAIRGVCRRWMVLIEDICREKKSILIRNQVFDIFSYYTSRNEVSEQFNGLVTLDNNWITFSVKSKNYSISLSNNFTSLLANQFPQVENFVIYSSLEPSTCTSKNLLFLLSHWSSSIVTLSLPSSTKFSASHRLELSDYIDKLTSLKRLDLFEAGTLKPTTLARLEHCSMNESALLEVVSHLGINCTSLNMYESSHRSDLLANITQWPKMNDSWVKSVTHLKIHSIEQQVLPFVCDNFRALQMLDMNFPIFNADTIAQLAQLSHLTQLIIERLDTPIEGLSELVGSKMATLNSVQVLSMFIFDFEIVDMEFDGDKFCRVLSFIFPNIVQLNIENRHPTVCHGITDHYLDHFSHLRKLEIDCIQGGC